MSWFRKSNDTTEHKFTEERLSAYLDGELSAQERSVVDRHLASCRECRWQLNTLSQTVKWTRDLPTLPVPRSFAVPVAARTVPAPRAVRQRGWGLPVMQAATALVAVLFLSAAVAELYLPQLLPASAPHREAVSTQAAAVEVTQVVEAQATAAPVAATAAAQAYPPPAAQETLSPEEQAATAAPPGMGAGAVPAAPEPTQPAAETEGARTESAATAGVSTMVSAGVQPKLEAPQALTETQTLAAAEMLTTIQPLSATAELTSTQLVSTTAELAATEVETPTTVPTEFATATASAEIPTATAPAELPTATPPAEPTPAVLATTVAELQEPSEPYAADQGAAQQETTGPRRPAAGWLGGAVVGLGVAFVVMGTTTIILMVRRLRRS